MQGINDKVAIVTGAAKGLGRAIALRLLKEGAIVILADILEKELSNTVLELTENGFKAEKYIIDVREISAIDDMVDTVYKKYGKLDILVNNVGVQIRDWATEFKETDWDKLMDINLKSYYFASRSVARIMKKNGKGSIVCISSTNAKRFTSKRTPYCISKAAINGLVAALGNELGRFGIRVNGVAPGYVLTDMAVSAMKANLMSEETAISVTPLKRFILPEEIASSVCFLASDEASGITGQTLFVDGGWSINGLPEPKDME